MDKDKIKDLREKIKDKEYMKKAMESIAERIILGEINLKEGVKDGK